MANASFKDTAARALADAKLQRALLNVKRGFIIKRAAAKSKLPEFDQLRDEARAIRDHTLAHLDLYLEAYERKVVESGGEVHFAPTAADARRIVLRLCRDAGARLVTKGKSMVSEEIGLNAHLEAAGIEVAETDLGEHISQIRGEAPSHIIAPVIHLNRSRSPRILSARIAAYRKTVPSAQRKTSRPRPAPCCGRSLSPPTSASLAPTCSSPRQDPRLSSPMRETAI